MAESPLAEALHKLRSALSRVKGEVELAALDGVPPPPATIHAIEVALRHLHEAERASDLAAEISVRIIEDEPGLAEVTARRLRRAGIRVETTGSPRALEVLVADLGALRRLPAAQRRAIAAQRPVVVSGAASADAHREADLVGASAFLRKPVPIDELVAAIRRRVEELRSGSPGASRGAG